jgi:hypothetical protein
MGESTGSLNMKIYVYTDNGNGTRQVAMPVDNDTLELILASAPSFGHVVGDKTWNENSVNLKTGERGGEIRLITLTPAALDMQGHITVMDEIMRVAVPHLRPGGRMWL